MTETSRQLLDAKVHIWLRTQCLDCGQMRIDRVVQDVTVKKLRTQKSSSGSGS